MADIMDSITQLGVEVVMAAMVGAGLAVWVVGAVVPVRAAIIILINSSGKYSRNTNNNQNRTSFMIPIADGRNPVPLRIAKKAARQSGYGWCKSCQ